MSSAASNNRKSMEIPNIDEANEPIRELFEACKTGDLTKVKKFINPGTVNARDLNGRKSTALHFSAGKFFVVEKNKICVCPSLQSFSV